MSKGKSAQYRGKLEPSQIAEGMNAARRNARRLADDARLLIESGRFPTAASLAALSIEESGKISVLRQLAGAPHDEARRRAWKDYRTHRSKNAAWILPSLVVNGARDLDSLRLSTDASAEHTANLDKVKQIGLYTDCWSNAHWSEPDNAIDEALARSLVGIADLLAREETTTAKEIELWACCMRPVYGAPLEDMKAALLDWFNVMEELGLRTEGTISAEAFVLGARED